MHDIVSIVKQISGMLLLLFIIDGLRNLSESIKIKIGLTIAYLTSVAILAFLIKLVNPISDSTIRRALMKKLQTQSQPAQIQQAKRAKQATPRMEVNIWVPSRREIITYLLTPDSREIALFVMGFIIVVAAFKAYTLEVLFSGYFLFYWGFTEVFIFYYRWGYAGINHFFGEFQKTSKKMLEKEIKKEPTYDINLKIPGLIISTLIFAYGFAIT